MIGAMIKWLKRHFIPHEGNSFRPQILHRKNTEAVVGVLVLVEIIVFILPVINFSSFVDKLHLSAVLPGVLATLTNEERGKNSLPTLAVSPILNQAAQLKAEDMAAKSYFAHNSPEGRTPWYWLDLVGYKYFYAGENLAVHFSDSQDVTDAWMNSPGHRANIVGRNYTEMGTGIATGVYEGQKTIFVAQVYASSMAQAQQQNSISAPTKSAQKNALSSSALDARSTPTDVVRDVFPEQLSSPSQATEVLGETVQENQTVPKSPNFWQKLLSSPRQTTNAILYAVLAIVLIALFLNIAIKFEYQFPDLIANGAVVAVLILGIYFTNSYVANKDFKTSFVAYDSPQTEGQ